MIPVTPLRGRRVLINADLIEEVESTPETIIVLANGRRLFVIESPAEIIERVGHLRASVLACVDDILEGERGVVVPFPGAAQRQAR